ncbi:MAG: hypothetical protein M1818_002292 [Claussenomyces sp. TS43310]|nr:MAG: hypothetical protein M1818_002292 [Claussenomyces sp. TS43310]
MAPEDDRPAESSRDAPDAPEPLANKPLPPTPSQPTPTLRRRNSNATLRSPSLRFSQSRPSIRIQRPPSTRSLQRPQSTHSVVDLASPPIDTTQRVDYAEPSSRRRSSSEPQRPQWAALGLGPPLDVPSRKPVPSYMPGINEESSRNPSTRDLSLLAPPETLVSPSNSQRSRASSFLGRRRSRTVGNAPPPRPANPADDEYGSDLIDLLDVVDPEVSTLTSLTNVQNSLFVPDLGRYLNRRPTYTLSRHDSILGPKEDVEKIEEDFEGEDDRESTHPQDRVAPGLARSETLTTISSSLSDNTEHYAVLPHGTSLEGWTAADKQELNDHVRHLLHSRRAKFKRGMKGFKQYASKPLGFFVTVYATLITLFGFAWVLFLIGWINLGEKKLYIINVIDNVLVALFAIMGDGLAPFRAVDTYHMIFIAHYHHLTWRLRREKELPALENENDLPLRTEKDVEAIGDHEEVSVLNEKQQERLIHHQTKFSNSHTFYKPHETVTHFAFPLRLLVAVVVLLDFHSIFQIALGTCTWSISYHVRPFALTTVILCCSIACNITAGVLILVGDKKTRKKDVVERMMRQDLTEQAINKLKKRRLREQQRNAQLDADGALPLTIE